MLQISSQTVLVAVHEFKNLQDEKVYLVGSDLVRAFPESLAHQVFLNANWNRAPKYGEHLFKDLRTELFLTYPDLDLENYRSGFYQFTFTFYYEEKTEDLITLGKTPFDQAILDQPDFHNFLNYLLERTNAYQSDDFLIPERVWESEFVQLTPKDFKLDHLDHMIVGSNTEIPKHAKFKHIIRASDHVGYKELPDHRMVYYYDENSLSVLAHEFSYVDPLKSHVYLDGHLNINDLDEVFRVRIDYEDQRMVKQFTSGVYQQLFDFLQDDPLLPLHFFNFSGKKVYLDELFFKLNSPNYSEFIEQLTVAFEALHSNHFPYIYQQKDYRLKMMHLLENQQELENFVHEAKRFGVLEQDELDELAKLRLVLK